MGMSTCNQSRKSEQQDNFSVRVKTRLLVDRSSVTALAKKLGLCRNTVSKAIHHPFLPTVRQRIAKELAL